MATNTQRTNIWVDGTKAGSTYAELKKAVNLLNKEIKDLPRNSDDYKKKVLQLADANKALTEHKNQIRGISDSYKPAQNNLKSLLSQFAPAAGIIGIATMAIGGLTAGVTSWYKNNKNLEKSLSSLKSLTGASAEDLKFYKREAIELGASTTLSATQVVDAYKVIGSAKPDLLANKQALNDVTKETITLAEAAEMQLEPAARAVTGILNQYGLQADQTGRAVNVLAAGSKEGSAEITDLSDSIDKSGSVLNGYNVSIEESVGLLEMLAERNLKGAEAGTQLRNVILTMQGLEALPANAVQQLEKYGVNAEIVTNTALPLNERLKEMSKIAHDATATMQVFGKENIVAATTILKNVDKVQELTDAVTGTNVAYEQQRINNDNLDGDLKSLSSAWEGFTLSVGGGNGALRSVVQVGTSVLNWTSDTITAFKEMDGLKIETQFLKVADALTFGIGPFHDYLEQQIRMNEITSEMIETTRAGAEEINVLTSSLMKNNEALANSNLTSEERAEIEAENARIIEELNTRFPELTANIDLHRISTEEMNVLQKAMNETMVEQAIQTAKVAEQEKILQEIISNTIEKQRLRAQFMDDSNKGIIGSFTKAMAAWDLVDVDKNIKKGQKNLQNLDKDFAQVEKTIKSMNLSAGSSFEIHEQMAKDAENQIAAITKRMEKITDPQKRKGLEAQLRGLKQTVGTATKENAAALDALLKKTDQTAAADEAATKKSTEAFKKQQEAKKAHVKAIQKLEDDLKKIIESGEKMKSELAYEKRLRAFEDEQQKELFALQHSLDQKYASEIASAEKIAKEKGNLGIKGQEQLQLLQQLKEEEFNMKKLDVEKKYQDKLLEERKKATAEELKQRASLDDALTELRVSKAQIAMQTANQNDVEAYRLASEELMAALDERILRETEKKKSALQLQYMNQEISQAEFDARMDQIDLEHKSKIELQHQEHVDKLMQMDRQRAESMLNGMSEVLNIIDTISQANYQKELGRLNDEKHTRIAALDESLSKNLIDRETYEKQREEIEKTALAEENKLKNEQAKKDKDVALAQATIQMALSILKAAPNPATMILAGLAGAAQIALIASTEVPQYADGGYHNVIGANDKNNYRARMLGKHKGGMLPSTPSLILASERGPEYYVPNHLLRNRRVVSAVNTIEAIRTNQMADGGFSGGNLPTDVNDPLVQALNENTMASRQLVAMLPHLGIHFGDRDIENLESRQNELNSMK